MQLAAVAVLSGVAVAGTIYGTQAIRREKRVEELKASIPELNESHHADMVRSLVDLMSWSTLSTDRPSEAYRVRRGSYISIYEQRG